MKWELYNLPSYRTELHDLSSEKRELAEELVMEFNNWAKRNGAISKEVLDNKK